MTFRPRTGDYFFIMEQYEALMRQLTAKVSVPVLGIIFYQTGKMKSNGGLVLMCFRPRIGDYFFIIEKPLKKPGRLLLLFPSPYWGLFFYRQYRRLVLF